MSSVLQTTPLCDWHRSHGAKMVDFSGWSMPVQYSSIVEEHRATRTGVGLFDISHMGRFRFDGERAVRFLDGLLTRAVARLKVGEVRYSLVTNEQGGILDDVLIYCLEDRDGSTFYELVVNAGNRAKLANWIESALATFGDGVAFRDETLQTAMIAVQGPQAWAAVAELVDRSLRDLAYYHGAVVEIQGQPALFSRTGYTGEDGYELSVAAASGVAIWDTLLKSTNSAVPVGLGARDTLRLEAGMPLYGHELSEETDPFQAGLGFAVQLRGREFVGSEALRRLKAAPRAFKQVGLELEGKRVAREGYSVLSDGEVVGSVTSGTFSPTLERPIALAYVRPEVAERAAPLDVDIRGRTSPAAIVELPFYRRS